TRFSGSVPRENEAPSCGLHSSREARPGDILIDLIRRRLLQGSAAGVGLAALGLPGAALAQLSPPAKLRDIDHIIVLMKENRSFDHYFGTLSGVRGFADVAVPKLAD